MVPTQKMIKSISLAGIAALGPMGMDFRPRGYAQGHRQGCYKNPGAAGQGAIEGRG